MKLAVAVVAVYIAVLGGTAAADVTIATRDDDTITITAVSHDKLKRVFSGAIDGPGDYVFSDAHTLWVLARDTTHGDYVVKITDGKSAIVGSFTPKDFGASFGDSVRLHAGKAGEVWLERCGVTGPKGCTQTAYLRLDGDKPVLTTTAPADVADQQPTTPAELAAPPRGYAFHLREHGGNWGIQNAVTCTAPGGKGGLWSSSMLTAGGAWWVMDKPAVLAINAFDPMTRAMVGQFPGGDGDVDIDLGSDAPASPPAPHASAPTPPRHASVFLEDCRDVFEDLYVLPDGLWGAGKGTSIRIKRGSRLLGTIRGYDPRIAPVVATP